jgi:hypothetical protein
VLNYWFYLLTVGGTGTNDVFNEYHVTGIGMAKAARIAYATELALSNTSTYANCRAASIAAATTIYGACSPEVEAVTRAWYAVNVGGNFVPCTPQVSFDSEVGSVSEDAGINDCRPSHVVSVPVSLNGVTALAGDSATISVVVIGGTAVAGVDYDLVTPAVTFKVGGAVAQAIAIKVYDNGLNDANKYIDLTYSLAPGASNVTKSVYLDTTRVNIYNDDYLPYAGASEQRQVFNYNVLSNTSSPFLSSALGAHNQYLYRAPELLAAGIRPGIPLTAAEFFVLTKYSTMPFYVYTVKLANTPQENLQSGVVTSGFTTVFSDSVTTAIGWTAIPFSTPFTWNGTDNLVIDICFTNPSRVTNNDRVQGYSGAYSFGAAVSSNFNSGCSLPLTVYNLAAARPVVRFTQPTQIETVQNGTRTWEVKRSQDIYFYSQGAKKLIAAINNPSDSLGCVTATVTASGNGFVQASGGSRRSMKEFMITPTHQGAGITFDAIFYVTNAELGGVDPYKVKIVQTTSANDDAMRSSNTNFVTPNDVIVGLDYTGFRGSFTGFNRFFLTDGNLALGVDGTAGRAAELWTGANPFQKAPVLHWNLPKAERVNIRLYDITGKLVYGSEHTLEAGTHQLSLSGNADFAPGSYVLQVIRPSGVFTRQMIKQ